MSADTVRPEQRKAKLVRVPANVSAAQAVGRLRRGARVIGLTKGQFSMLDLVRAVQAQVGSADVCVSTWTIAASDSLRVAEFLADGAFRSFRLVIDRSFPGRYPQYCAGIIARFGPGSIRMTRTHAKFALVGAGDWRVVIRSSMNLNPNPRCEQYELDDDAEIYRFFDDYVREMYAAVPEGLDVDGGVLQREFEAIFGREERQVAARRARTGLAARLNREIAL